MSRKKQYADIAENVTNSSLLAHIVKQIAIYIIYVFQNVPVSANFVTFFSLIPVIAAVYVLVFFNMHILFAFLLFLSYLIDCIDGIWARLKNQTSVFGQFFDPFLDEVKDLLIDFGFIIHFYGTIHTYITDNRILLGVALLYLIIKSVYYIARDHYLLIVPKTTQPNKKLAIIGYGGAEKNLIVFPLVSLSPWLFVVYFIAYFGLYLVSTFSVLHKTKLHMERA